MTHSEHAGPVLAERYGIWVVDCSQCGYIHASKWQPMDYATDFWQTRKAGELQHFLDQQEWLYHVYDILLSQLGAPGDMLDIGCGYGFWLARAELRGWDCIGLDPSIEAARYAATLVRGEIVACTWMEFRQKRVDVITALWLLEHLENPEEFLSWCRERLRPGGKLMLAVPNEWTDEQANANDRAARPYWWVDPTHYGYFSSDSLKALLVKAGFRILQQMGTYPMEQFISEGFDYSNSSAVGRKAHQAVEKAELAMPGEELRRAYLERGVLGCGRDLIVFCGLA